MVVDADKLVGIEKKPKFHTFRFLLAMLAIYVGVTWYVKKNNAPLNEPVPIYSTIEEALAGPLPRYDYSSVSITDEVGPYDPVFRGKQLLGYVHDDAEMLLHDGKEIGYVADGKIYNASGKRVAWLASGKTGYDIHSYDNKKQGILTKEALINPSGAVIGIVGPKAAVLMDSSNNLIGIITEYDYSRKNQ